MSPRKRKPGVPLTIAQRVEIIKHEGRGGVSYIANFDGEFRFCTANGLTQIMEWVNYAPELRKSCLVDQKGHKVLFDQRSFRKFVVGYLEAEERDRAEILELSNSADGEVRGGDTSTEVGEHHGVIQKQDQHS